MADRDFKGVWIPKEIWLDKSLSMLEKGILTEIDSLDNGVDGCWASNEYIANFCQCSVPKVTNAISKLIDLRYIERVSFDGRKRVLRSCLRFSIRQTNKKYEADQQKVLGINISNKKENKSITRQGADSEILSRFDDFWSVYPRKVSKATASKAWAKLKPDDSLCATILADVKQRVSGEWKGKDVQYIPYPATYLNGKRWQDERPDDTPGLTEHAPDFMVHRGDHKYIDGEERKAMYKEMGLKVT